MSMFPENAPSAPIVFFRSYSHNNNGVRETWKEVCDRTITGLSKIGRFTDEEAALVYQQQYDFKCLSSGRWLWVGGRSWVENPKNFPGAYNCTSLQVNQLDVFGILMDLAMMGCGTGGVLTQDCIGKLPTVRNKLEVEITSEIGARLPHQREEKTRQVLISDIAKIWVGDSREGWVDAYQAFINLAFDRNYSENQTVRVHIDLGSVRPAGEKLNGFGGVSNPIKLPELFERCSELLNGAIGRQLNSIECCLLIDEAAATIVAGSIRRTAGMRQFDNTDKLAESAKDNLWYQDEIDGKWRIDEKRDALRMSNHSRVFCSKPTLKECSIAVRKQYHSGEGAIQWAGEAVARGNSDILSTTELRSEFLKAYTIGNAQDWLRDNYKQIPEDERNHRLSRYGLNPCHSGDTLVSTDRGLIQIKDLVGKHFQALVDLRSIGLVGTKLTDAIAFSTGVQNTYSILLENGLQMRCTAEHQHFTNQGWVATKDLTPDIAIYIQRGEGYFGKSDISVNQAQMLGWLYGDGSICQGHTGLDAIFYMNQKEYPTAFPVLFEAVESLTGYRHTPSLVKGLYTFHSGSRLMRAFFEKLNVKSKDCLPDTFLSQSKEVIIGFLQGLFSSDGAASLKARQIDICNRSYTLLSQIQLLLLNLGIKSSLRIKQEPGGAGIPYTLKDGTKKISQNQGSWRLLIYSGDGARNFYKLIGFPLAPEKQQRLEQIANKPRARYYSETVVNLQYTSKVKSVQLFGEEPVYDLHVPLTHSFIANGCITHNCGEILGADFMCDLSEVHLNNIDARSLEDQVQAFKAGALSVSALLHHQFDRPLLQKSRELDPIVGVSFTGLFDFFVQGFGVDWLRWWQAGRPEFYGIGRIDPAIEAICAQFNIEIDDYETVQETGWNFGMLYRDLEQTFLESWREIVENAVREYCEKHSLKCPNRCTTTQPAGSKSLLTGASPGWHPPKSSLFIRRITVGKNNPIGLAAIDCGYSVVPAQSDKDENGQLLDDPFDERCTEWLIEIPTQTVWATWPGVQDIDISQFSAEAQFDFYMQVQKFYTRHNTSATIEVREHEVEALGKRIFDAIQNDEGYVSAAILARFDEYETFPRMPFQPISKETYDRLCQEVEARRTCEDFYEAISKYTSPEEVEGPAACDSDKCLMPLSDSNP